MSEQQYQGGDIVAVDDDLSERTVMQYSEAVDKYQVQRGNDSASIEWIESNRLKLLHKNPRPDAGASFYPDRPIM
jgi:hypothetical protein